MLNNPNNITDLSHWETYWTNYQFDKIPRKVVFGKFIPRLDGAKSFIEIGGFPGIFAAYFYKHGIPDVTVLDFYMNTGIVRKFETVNDLPEHTIRCIDTDFFKFSSEKKYDVVFSSGFIEHFKDTRDVIARHVDLLSENGHLLVLIPNFLGLNGKIQQRFDKENLDAHNLSSMEIARLQRIMQAFDLKDVEIDYLGKPMLWLEPKPENRRARRWIKLLSYAVKLFPVKGRFLSPFIAVYARK